MKFMALAYPMIILIDIIAYLNFFSWNQQADYEFKQRQLDIQVNYSIDAAANEMLRNGSNIDTDYAEWGRMTIYPEVALRGYEAVLLRNFGWKDTVQNRQDLEAVSIPFFVVATYDGYYNYCMQKELVTVNGVDQYIWSRKWTPKIPYSEYDEDNQTSYYYNLGDYYYNKVNGNTLYTNQALLDDDTKEFGTKQRANIVVSESLSKACNDALFTALEGQVQELYYIPSEFNSWSQSNSVNAPSIITYLSKEGSAYKYDQVTFGIGGATIEEADFCICYKRPANNGTGYTLCYTWADNRHLIEAEGISIERVVSSATKAAELGYYYDVTLLEGF